MQCSTDAGSPTHWSALRPPRGKPRVRRLCYFNNTAIAAEVSLHHARVAILDLDYHHGNGQQEIFWERGDVLTLSIHGHPNFAYPYFSGFADERGAGDGLGANRNYPLEESVEGPRYREVLTRALPPGRETRRRDPGRGARARHQARKDPTGTWNLSAADFTANGRMVSALRLPTLVVQEGGYQVRSLGVNARSFFTGLWQEAFLPGWSGTPDSSTMLKQPRTYLDMPLLPMLLLLLLQQPSL